MIKLNLGCGSEFSDELIGFDLHDYGQQHVGFDLEKDKLPFKANSVDFIKSNHCIEHLTDVRHAFNEAWRVLKKDGVFEVKVPYGLWEGASKPVHKQCITPCWFDFFRKEKTKVYGYKRWKINKLYRLTNGEIDNKNGAEVFCSMTPDK